MKSPCPDADFFHLYLQETPFSLALVRSLECKLFAAWEFPEPVLDAGCGDGLWMSVVFKGETIDTGVDVSNDEIALARSRGNYRHLRVTSLEESGLPDDHFGSIICNCVCEHTFDIRKIMSESYRILKPGGLLAISVPSDLYGPLMFWAALARLLGLKGLSDWYDRTINGIFKHYHYGDRRYWSDLLETPGFRIEQFRTYVNSAGQKAFDLMLIPALPALVIRKLTGRWRLFDRSLVAWVVGRLMRRFYVRGLDDPRSAYFFIVARKPS